MYSDENGYDFEPLDRSSIGDFAVPASLLTWFDYNYGGGEVGLSGHNVLSQMCASENVAMEMVMGEFLFWSDRLYLPSWVHERNLPTGKRSQTFEWKAKLVLVDKNPEMHDYFRYGIWDVKRIETLMSNGVDASLGIHV